MSRKVLIATDKPFAGPAAAKVEAVLKEAGYKVSRLEKYKSKADLLKVIGDAEAVIIRSDVIDKEVLDAAKSLKIVVRAGAGYDNVDCDYAKQKGVVVMNTPGQNANAVAELAIAMMIYMARNQFNGSSGTELKGKTLGIMGFGAVGRNIARIARGIGMTIVSVDPFVDAECMSKEANCRKCEASDIFSTADYVSLNIPATKENLKCVNYDTLMKMRKGACIVNTARAEIIDEAGLAKAMAERADLRYATDVEPKGKDLFAGKFAERYYCTPKKLGAQTEEANENAGVAAAHQIVGFFERKDVKFQVNK